MKTFLVVVSLVTLARMGMADDFGLEIKPYVDGAIRKNSLRYLESCNYSLELERIQLSKDILDLVRTTLDEYGDRVRLEMLKSDMVRTTKDMAEVSGSYCNGYDNLQCNSSGLCACVDGSRTTFGVNISFVREGDHACQIAEGSICFEQQSIDKIWLENPFRAPRRKLTCAGKRTCVIKSSLEDCSTASSQNEVERLIEEHGQFRSQEEEQAFLKRLTEQGICICGGCSLFVSSILIFGSLFFALVKWIF